MKPGLGTTSPIYLLLATSPRLRPPSSPLTRPSDFKSLMSSQSCYFMVSTSLSIGFPGRILGQEAETLIICHIGGNRNCPATCLFSQEGSA